MTSTLPDISVAQGNRVSARVRVPDETITAVTGQVRERRVDLTGDAPGDPLGEWVWEEGVDGYWDGYLDTEDVPTGSWWTDWRITTDATEADGAPPYRTNAARCTVGEVVDVDAGS